MPARASVARKMLPIGLAHGVRLVRAVAADQPVTEDDIEPLEETLALELRRQTQAMAR